MHLLMRAVLVGNVCSNDRTLARGDEFIVLRASTKLRSMLACMRCELVVHLDAIKAGVMSYLVNWLQVVIANRFSMEVDGARRRLLYL